ncbi:MAG: hemerythrin family protein [Lachnospiraceae bacterium]
MSYTWSKDLETGNATIDGQHKELIQAINKLLDACSAGKGRAEVEQTSQFLLNYTSRHFADEEKLQIQSKYPDYPNHKRYHTEFVKVVQNITKELDKEGPTIVMVGKVNTAIAGWLLNHIKREDAKVAAHIRSVES